MWFLVGVFLLLGYLYTTGQLQCFECEQHEGMEDQPDGKNDTNQNTPKLDPRLNTIDPKSLPTGAVNLDQLVGPPLNQVPIIQPPPPSTTQTATKSNTPIKSDPKCYDLLIDRGDSVSMYNTRLPEQEGINPVVFPNLNAYMAYVEDIRNNGKDTCPVLFLTKMYSPYGEVSFRKNRDPAHPDLEVPVQSDPQNPAKIIDASDDNPPFNQNQFPGFDPLGLDVGIYTEIDAKHDAYDNVEISANPASSNWGGVHYTQQMVDAGKFKDREIVKPLLSTPSRTVTYPEFMAKT